MKRVTGKVSALTLERDGNKIKASYKVPSWMSDTSKDDHACWIDHEMRMDRTTSSGEAIKPICKFVGNWDGPDITSTGADRYWIRGQERSSSIEKNYDRGWFHPVKVGIYCNKVVWGAFGGNAAAGSGWGASMSNIGPIVWAQRNFYPPRKPSVSWAYDTSTQQATVTVKTDEGKDWYERYDTMYMVTLRRMDGKEITLRKWASSRSTEIAWKYDLSPYITGLQAGKYVTITCKAYARGMAGDNPSAANPVTASRSVVFPLACTLGKPTCDKKAPNGRIKVPINNPGGWYKLQQLQRKNGDGSWTDVDGATDNQDAKALYDSYGAADPQPGEYVYYRIKATRDGFTNYSAAVRADCLYTAKPKETCSATCKLATLKPNSAGTQIQVVMAWKESTANTGCELSWSEYPNGWNTTEAPNTIELTGKDNPTKLSGWNTRTESISGLTPGKTYYIRMRRYKEYASGNKVFSAYDIAGKATPCKTESAADDRCGIISVSPWKSGTSATVVVGYTEDNTNKGTELSWSTSSGAWSSSSIDPDTDTFPTAGVDSSTKWQKQVTLYLQDVLDGGTTYYIRARRYMTDDGTTSGNPISYTPYSEAQKFSTETAADDSCAVVSVTPSTSGKTATVVIGINEDGPNTGTEITWSDYSAAWWSNTEPESMLATWGKTEVSDQNPPYRYEQTSYLRDLTPGKTYYMRARRYLEAGGKTTYTPWSARYTFKTPRAVASNDKCGIVSITPHADGMGANVVVGWTEDTANDGTELTWSTDSDAWTSNKQPNSMQATWSDKTSKSADWAKTQTVSLHDLERGETYYVKARRYKSDDEGETFSPYAQVATITLPAVKTDDDVRCGLVSVTAGEDGVSAIVIVGWDGDHTGCEVTWSKDPDAWESSEQPQSMNFDWTDKWNKSGFKTEDQAIDSSKTYYARNGDEIVGFIYSKVEYPTVEEIDDYYELAWAQTSTLYLRELEEGETYYVKARSYFDGKDGTSWSDYTSDMPVTPFAAPSSVTLSAPSAVARGESIECYWTIGSEMEQVEWHIHEQGQPRKALASGTGSLCHASIPAERYEGLDSISFYVSAGCGGGLTDSNVVSVGIADEPACEAWVSAELAEQPVMFEVYTSNLETRLLCTLKSDGVTVFAPDGDRDQLVDDVIWTRSVTPTWSETTWGSTELYSALEDDVEAAETAQSAAAAAFGETTEAQALSDAEDVMEDAKEAFDATPEAIALAELTPGDEGYAEAYVAAWTTEEGVAYASAISDYNEAYEAAWTTDEGVALSDVNAALEKANAALEAHPEDDSCYMATLSLPPELDLIDGSTYRLLVAAVEPVAGLTSDIVECGFAVAWSHQAVAPSSFVTVTPSLSGRSVTIALAEPTGADTGDVYDIYRPEVAGHVLVAENIPLDGGVVDMYAPFGKGANLHYRVCLRTVDGDFEFIDIPYSMPVGGMRFDWDGKFVELPYNVNFSESYSKDFEARSHVDGETEGYFGSSVNMTGSFTTDLIKVDMQQLDLVRKLGKYPGAVFCRTSMGTAFQCNVDVSELSLGYNSMAAAVSLNVTRVALTDQFKCHGGDMNDLEPDDDPHGHDGGEG